MSADVTPLIPEAERNMTAAQLKSSGDVQLLKAIQVLSNPKSSNSPSNANKPSSILVPEIAGSTSSMLNQDQILGLELFAIWERPVT